MNLQSFVSAVIAKVKANPKKAIALVSVVVGSIMNPEKAAKVIAIVTELALFIAS